MIGRRHDRDRTPRSTARLAALSAVSDATFQEFEFRRQQLEARGLPRRIAATKAADDLQAGRLDHQRRGAAAR